ncbi:MAG: patatin-like phospholipase family protein [Candidatus Binatia bacterium]
MTTLQQRIQAPGPKKILALDGGGIRGMLTVEVLAAIEAMLRRALHRDENFVLADYFDYIAGTSTGAIIATCLSWGMSVNQIRDFYLQNGRQMFDKASLLRRHRYKYEDANLSNRLQQEFGPATTLGTDKLRTLLMMMMRNATTDSPWPISNNPHAKYNDRSRADCNLDLPLWQLVRASTAAPVYFPPEVVRIGNKEFIFVDGGITPYNNPAFQVFLMATLEPYNLNWPTGEENLLIVSIGTGTNPEAEDTLSSSDMHLFYNATTLPSALMYAALNEQDLLCRTFGKCLVGDQLDSEIGDLIGTKGPVSPKLFTYLRYNAELTKDGLQSLGITDINPKDVQQLDSFAHVEKLQRIGKAVAHQKVHVRDFASFLSPV